MTIHEYAACLRIAWICSAYAVLPDSTVIYKINKYKYSTVPYNLNSLNGIVGAKGGRLLLS